MEYWTIDPDRAAITTRKGGGAVWREQVGKPGTDRIVHALPDLVIRVDGVPVTPL